MDLKKVYSIAAKIHDAIGRNHPKEIYVNALDISLESEGINNVRDKHFPIVYCNRPIGTFKCDFVLEETNELVKVFTFEKNCDLLPEIELFKNQLKTLSGISRGIFINFIRSRKNSDQTENDMLYFERKKHVIVGKVNTDTEATEATEEEEEGITVD